MTKNGADTDKIPLPLSFRLYLWRKLMRVSPIEANMTPISIIEQDLVFSRLEAKHKTVQIPNNRK